MNVKLIADTVTVDGKTYPTYYIVYTVHGVEQRLKVRVNANERTWLDVAIAKSNQK